ncbi:MAG: methylenetetrahydrofolate--tRNA-(uracil(54)-C(5))-methyltransferase (FADH(2)-oxidizing) TrmFO [Kofleriaceae bacterium]|nr:methylenetetrahydrofolate--tRNA-(uracil(54)-C(5))-methyltransferase (FADH(2)-oxidizing) TrmFO [Kofleriaceae bacterium]
MRDQHPVVADGERGGRGVDVVVGAVQAVVAATPHGDAAAAAGVDQRQGLGVAGRRGQQVAPGDHRQDLAEGSAQAGPGPGDRRDLAAPVEQPAGADQLTGGQLTDQVAGAGLARAQHPPGPIHQVDGRWLPQVLAPPEVAVDQDVLGVDARRDAPGLGQRRAAQGASVLDRHRQVADLRHHVARAQQAPIERAVARQKQRQGARAGPVGDGDGRVVAGTQQRQRHRPGHRRRPYHAPGQGPAALDRWRPARHRRSMSDRSAPPRALEPEVTVVGAGMAGCEAAWQLARLGRRVALVEQKPAAMSPAHQSVLFGELVCSNSLRSDELATPAGLLKDELRRAGSLVIACAEAHRVPAGGALAVERIGFATALTRRLALHPGVRIERRGVGALPDGKVIVATGPLTGGPLAEVIRRQLGGDRMYFYDAIAPIVAADSIDWDHAFRASRWGREAAPPGPAAADGAGAAEADADADAAAGGDVGVGDYVNCPLDKAGYEAFVAAIVAGRKVLPHDFEEPKYFEGCMPIEVMAERGPATLRFGPMRPIGLRDPRTGHRPWAVVQLRPENRYLSAYNLVGFQTRLAYPEQQRIFAMIPALRQAEFVRFGSIHRNTYVDAPSQLGPTLALRGAPAVHLAGLLTGVEGYIESCAMGLLVAWMVAAELAGRTLPPPPPTTMLGALYQHVTGARPPGARYQPTNVNFGLLPPLTPPGRKDEKRARMVARAQADLSAWLAQVA